VLERIGFVGAVLARRLHDGSLELIDGHLRRDLLGNQEVTVLVTDLNEAEADEILATHDQLGTLALPDSDKLRSLLGSLKANDVPLIDMGWPEYKLDQVLPKDGGWQPVMAPTTTPTGVSPDDVAKAEQELQDRFDSDQGLAPVLCPHCAQEFYVRPGDLKVQAEAGGTAGGEGGGE
jgi:hypothetical protein